MTFPLLLHGFAWEGISLVVCAMRYRNEAAGNNEEEWSCIDEKVEGAAADEGGKDEKEEEDFEEASERS
jgi:hypothetical protein